MNTKASNSFFANAPRGFRCLLGAQGKADAEVVLGTLRRLQVASMKRLVRETSIPAERILVALKHLHAERTKAEQYRLSAFDRGLFN